MDHRHIAGRTLHCLQKRTTGTFSGYFQGSCLSACELYSYNELPEPLMSDCLTFAGLSVAFTGRHRLCTVGGQPNPCPPNMVHCSPVAQHLGFCQSAAAADEKEHAVSREFNAVLSVLTFISATGVTHVAVQALALQYFLTPHSLTHAFITLGCAIPLTS